MFFLTFIKTKTLIFTGMLFLALILTVNGSSRDEIKSELERARTNLRISQATEERIASELEQLKNSGKATPETVKDYETYLNRVQSMVNENQKIVDNMEETYSKHLQTAKSTGCSKSKQIEGNLYTEIPNEKEPGEATDLDHTLDDSLAAFDEMLLKEMDDIRAKSENKMTDLAEEAAAAAKRLRDRGVDVSSSSEETGSDEQGESYAKVPVTDGQDKKSRSDDDETYDQQDKTPRGSTQDDDIVARQLREAAEKETDPELKEKLWKEYEDYKRGSK